MINSKDDFSFDYIFNNLTVSKVIIDKSTTFSIQLTEIKQENTYFSNNNTILIGIILCIFIAVLLSKVGFTRTPKYTGNFIC